MGKKKGLKAVRRKRSQQIIQQRHGQEDRKKTRRVWCLRGLEKRVLEEEKSVKYIQHLNK